tara:strand:+ start:300 stop:452 length:153 start_codon:yes stop_codon:yes gene_type:complete
LPTVWSKQKELADVLAAETIEEANNAEIQLKPTVPYPGQGNAVNTELTGL